MNSEFTKLIGMHFGSTCYYLVRDVSIDKDNYLICKRNNDEVEIDLRIPVELCKMEGAIQFAFDAFWEGLHIGMQLSTISTEKDEMCDCGGYECGDYPQCGICSCPYISCDCND